jgi:hypothetical protein
MLSAYFHSFTEGAATSFIILLLVYFMYLFTFSSEKFIKTFFFLTKLMFIPNPSSSLLGVDPPNLKLVTTGIIQKAEPSKTLTIPLALP